MAQLMLNITLNSDRVGGGGVLVAHPIGLALSVMST
jgi:hypothetical protein